jgi:hypothetical protein
MASPTTVKKFRAQAAANAAQMTAAAGGSPAAQQSASNAAASAASLLSDTTSDPTQVATQLSTIAQSQPIAFAAASQLVVSGAFAKWEAESSVMNPIGGPTRRKPFPVKILPAQSTATASGTGTLTWTPQEEFEGFRLCVPSGQAGLAAAGATYFAQLQAGDRLMQAQSGRVPAACWSEKSDLGRIDFPITRLGETLTMTYTGATASTELCAVILGYARGKARKLPDGAILLYERVEPFDVTAVAPGATGTITLQPQRNIVMRRIGFDDTVSGFSGLFVTSINVQDDPQFTGTAEIPAQLFSELAQDDWLDFDMCQLGGEVTIGLRNANTSLTINVQGMALVDLVRLPGDAR